jgi:hypothetical protein
VDSGITGCNLLQPSSMDLKIVTWVSKDTYLLTKETMDVTFTYDDGFGQIVVNMTASFLFYDINVPVAITLPDEAIAAEDVS